MAGKGPIYKRANLTDEAKEDDHSFGLARKTRLSRLNNPICFFVFAMLAVNMSVSGIIYQSASITTIERRFQLKSQQTAILPIITEIVGIVTMLFVVHYGSSGHRPRVMSSVLVLSGFGLVLYCVPHFFYPKPSFLQDSTSANETVPFYTVGEQAICSPSDANDEVEACSDDQLEESGALLGQAIWLFLGAALVGLSTSFYPLFITHLDDGVQKRHLSVYLGVMYATFVLGMLTAFLLASVCLQIPAYVTDPEFRELTPYDPRFLGAWWLGFFIIGVLQIIFSIPIFFFPRLLPIPKITDPKDDKDGDEMGDLMIRTAKLLHSKQGENFMLGLLKSVWRVLSNPTIFFCYCSYVAFSLYFAGFSLFGPKYMQIQFGLNPYRTAFLSAIIMIPPGLLGNLLGGIITRYFGKSRRELARLVLILAILQMLVEPLSFMFGCENSDIAGLTVQYDDHMGSSTELPNLDVECNYDCGCESIYSPVCGSDGMTYASGCFAGCREVVTNVDNPAAGTIYLDCSCIASASMGDVMNNATDHSAVNGNCQSDVMCNYLIPYLIWSPVAFSIGIISAIPTSLIQIRSVDLPDRPMGMGMANVFSKLFGYMPGPLIYGVLIDSACLMFQSSCGETGNCLLYDVESFRYLFVGLNNLLRVIGTVFVFLVFLSIRLGWDKREGPIDKEEDTKDEKLSMKGITDV